MGNRSKLGCDRARQALTGFALVSVAIAAGAGETFTVRDSIEIERFSDPSARDPAAITKTSPDGGQFVVVTTRGLVDVDAIESTLWLFDSRRVREFAAADRSAAPPAPVALVRLRGMISTDQDDSYGSLITSVTWSGDSTAVYYLGETGDGVRQLFKVGVGDHTPRALTSRARDIQTFGVAMPTVVFTGIASKYSKETVPGRIVNRAASDITGLTLDRILFPESWSKGNQSAKLIIARENTEREVIDPRTGRSLAMSPSTNAFRPSVAPDSHSAIVPIPASSIPESWEAYTPGQAEFRFKATPAPPENQGDFLWPTQYGLLELDHGRLRPLIDAPTGWVAGYYDFPFAAWSPDSAAVLISNSYLPPVPGKTSDDSNASLPCAAVVVRLSTQDYQCVTRPRSAERNNAAPLNLFDGAFIGSADEVRLRLRSYGRIQEETYRYHDGSWNLVTTRTEAGDPAHGFGVYLKQGLNSPPALWVNGRRGHEKQLWNPAPQLDAIPLGEATVYRWKDATGYEWIGGLIKPVGYKNGQRYPLIIQTHGFHHPSEFITDGAFTTAFAARPLAAAGFVVLEVRDRHDHMLTPDEAADMVRGFESAVRQLDAEGVVDAGRVGIIGFSRTCYYVESALIHDPNLYAAASLTDGVDESYLQSIVNDVDSELVEGTSIYGAAPFGSGLKSWVASAPGFQLDKVKAPVLITALTPASVLQEWEIYSSLRQQSKPVSFLYIPGGQHILQNPLERMASQQSNVDWFRFWLQDFEDPDPAKAEQYKRWRELRKMQDAQSAERKKGDDGEPAIVR